MVEWPCDKCGKPVPLWNDAVALEVLTYRASGPSPFQRFMYSGRHLFRTEDCEGSPSRAKYFYGELGRDGTGYRWDHVLRWMYRRAYARLVQLARQ